MLKLQDIRTNIQYTLAHKRYFLKVEKKLLGKNTLRGYLHDLDKLFLYFFLTKKQTHTLHRRISRHHALKARTEIDYINMVIDWECARYTKKDKPLNAQETLYRFYPELTNLITPILAKLGLV